MRMPRRLAANWVRSRNRIRDTGVIRNPRGEFSVHNLTCHADAEMTLWALKSFSFFSGVSPDIVIHDDGTLTAEDRESFARHLESCVVVERSEADRSLHDALKPFPLCRRMRARPDFHCALKLFDPPFFSSHPMILLLDSDILFFRRPSELLERISQERPCFNSDYQDAYVATPEEVESSMGIELIRRVNAGLVAARRIDFDLAFMEEYFGHFASRPCVINWHEQTLQAALLSRAGAERLPEGYQISKMELGPETISHHFVTDGSRPGFFLRGVRKLRKSGMLEAISG